MKNTPIVSFSFDDGRETAVALGAQILERHGVHGTFYPITHHIGGENEHGKYASWEQIEALKKRGHEVGSHSHSHVKELKDWDKAAQKEDISRSLDLFSTHGIKAKTFAYPFGHYTDQLRKVVKELGFRAARTIETGINVPGTDSFILHSFMLEDKHTLSDIERELDALEKENGWLILTFHHINDKTYLSTPPELLDQIVRLVLKRGFRVSLIAEVRK